MPAHRWFVSVFLVWHVCALLLAALPQPERLTSGAPRRPARGVIAQTLTPWLDAAAAAAFQGSAQLAAWTAPFRAVTTPYIRRTGLAQRWRMFWNLPTHDEYLRVRYYIGERGSTKATWSATELVYPAHREDRIRLLKSFRDSYNDKAVSNAIRGFHEHRAKRSDPLDAPLPDDLAPLGRFWSRQFARGHLLPIEHVVRSEVWFARVLNPAPGTAIEPADLERRRDALRRYYGGPVENQLIPATFPAYRATEQEADIVWVLQYFEQ